MINSKERKLLKNTFMLYVLTFSGYFFNLITVPYQTRVLGPEVYGNLGFAQSFVTYFQMVLDFGFLLSATAEVSRLREDKSALSKLMTAVTCCKLILAIVCFVVITILCFSIERFQTDIPLYLLFFTASLFGALLPDYLYRGLEDMSAITYRSLLTKAFFAVMILMLLKTRDQYYLVPILSIMGNAGAFAWVCFDMYRRLDIRFVRVAFSDIWVQMKRSSSFFFSRIATTIYGATNSLILGFVYPNGSAVGYYTSADKLVSTARSALAPISDSMYPYLVRNKDFKLVKRIMWVLMPLIILGCTVLGLFAEPFCVLFFGEEYAGTGEVLRYLLPIVVLTLPSYLCGFPFLTALGMEKYANLSVVIGSVIQVIQLVILFAFGAVNVKTVCIATCVTESVVLLIRVGAIVYATHKDRRVS